MIVAVAPVIASCIRFAALVEKVLWKALATNPKMLKKIENDLLTKEKFGVFFLDKNNLSEIF